jgi:DHA2 family multidrug resistance protein
MNRPLNRPMITISIMLATIMQTLDSTIANVALPHMQGTLSASQDQIAWVLTAYIVASDSAGGVFSYRIRAMGNDGVFAATVGKRSHRRLVRSEVLGPKYRGARV